jgi:hypothetical protein
LKFHSIFSIASPVIMAAMTLSPSFAQGEEGGYVGTTDEGHNTVVYNFLRHFSFEQYYYCASHQWTWNNDKRVDNMDIAIYAGHGNEWLITDTKGGAIDLSNAGNTAADGYGDLDCEFIAFQSCYVVPSPAESASWASAWTSSTGVFDGLHQAVGFRTVSYQSTDQDMTDTFGFLVEGGAAIWQAWFAAINLDCLSDEMGCAVMYPTAENDTYYSFIADPPASSTWLKVWWQY